MGLFANVFRMPTEGKPGAEEAWLMRAQFTFAQRNGTASKRSIYFVICVGVCLDFGL